MRDYPLQPSIPKLAPLSQLATPPLRLGMTQWSHNAWQRKFYPSGTKSGERLARYAEVFNTVEGNTTFYASPSHATVANWKAATSDAFRFTFKFPQPITHQMMLRHSDAMVSEFITLMQPLHERIGLWKIQLPAAFGPQSLPDLKRFLTAMPTAYNVGVEVRHPAFFAKGDDERAFNSLLMEYNADRIIMDSRPVFAVPADTDALLDAQQKKPAVPVHAISTSNTPMVRFIGDPTLERNDAFFANWQKKIPQWIEEGKTPYLMIHTANNDQAPELAAHFYDLLTQQIALPPLAPLFPEDISSQISLL
ncbi:DUF72 domain-containing protein [Enterovibrio sp. ZSDZ42]|uniref:DUF72 domain-containing protein n=1 Tax=Enterovibrio gelatinilyticus TaxID=2899819 RepID=A0ABT5R508_9GAMM|nr:DUF72 domain-containing protein [Enterovibrio sp. ZSDZ42]MDD1795367.1 DUF72 domain-containing protein [Enterovibrio sp. ZSDZ42]